ncbi:hypothetical protein PAPYR_991 [Paratrimastix pyriformis]|uniref:Uncharacterized protein n=1 Tax=Paratrimastix pyriformis TaxID=342808 RepID=A0ABQ8UU46_9EUKA|nr:hypothetical protein PAPYR_991 [Paratrimastix pyriformis]
MDFIDDPDAYDDFVVGPEDDPATMPKDDEGEEGDESEDENRLLHSKVQFVHEFVLLGAIYGGLYNFLFAAAEKFETYRARFISRPGPPGLSLTPGVAWAWGPAVANGPLAQCGFTVAARRWVACPAQPRRPDVARVPPVAFDAPPEKKPLEGSKKSLTAANHV